LGRRYSDRPEVLQWQENTIRTARKTGYTKTLMGRYRPLPDINHSKPMMRGHAERAAINTPIQVPYRNGLLSGLTVHHARD
jgi:DNA polymerase-1